MTQLLTGRKSAEPNVDEYDVVIVGGGASGLSAGVFTSRYGLETLILDRGASAIQRCYNIGNYLGFLAIDPGTFLELGRAHARYEGCEIVNDLVVSVSENENSVGGNENESRSRFRLSTQDDRELSARYVIAASAYNADYLSDFSFHESGEHPVECDEATGRTPIDGLYVAGWLSGGPHQVIICAGHGARVAKAMIQDHRVNDGYWEDVAQYWDWQVEDGKYGDETWEAHVDEWIVDTIPDDEEVCEGQLDCIRDAIMSERLDFQLSEEERIRRLEDSRELFREYFLDQQRVAVGD
jgi:thioredoxin reductase (NADPH)